MLTNTVLTRCPLLFDTLITLLIFVLGAGLGRRLLSKMRLPDITPLEQGIFAASLGIGMLGWLPFILFSLGIGRPVFMAGATLLLALLLLPDEIQVIRGAVSQFSEAIQRWKAPELAPTKLLAFAVFPLLAVTFLVALCPPTDPDGLHYHLTAPLKYLEAGRFYYMPTILHVNWPMGVEMLFGIGLAFNGNYAVSLIQFGLGVLLLVSTYAFGKRIASPTVGWLSAGLLLFFIRGQMNMAYIDLGLTLFTLLVAYIYFVGWQQLGKEKGKPTQAVAHWWILASLFAGLTATSKLPGLLTIATLSVIIFLALAHAQPSGSLPSRLFVALRPSVGYLAIGLALVFPWMLRSWFLVHAPIYPYFGGLFGAAEWTPEWQKRLNEYFQMFNTLRTRRPSPETVVRVRALSCLVIAILGTGLCRLSATRPVRPLIAFLFAGLFLQIGTSGIYARYFLPIIPLCCLLIFWAIRDLLTRSHVVRWATACAVSLWLWGLWKLPANLKGNLVTVRETLPVALGSVSRDDFLTAKLPIYPILQWSNRNLPADAIMAMGVLDAYFALLERPGLTTSPWTQNAIRYDSYERLVSDFKRLKTTNLLMFDSGEITAAQLASVDKEAQVRATLERPLLLRLCAEYGTPVQRINDYVLYSLKIP